MSEKVDTLTLIKALQNLECKYGSNWDIPAKFDDEDFKIVVKFRKNLGIKTNQDGSASVKLGRQKSTKITYVAVNGCNGKVIKATTLVGLASNLGVSRNIVTRSKKQGKLVKHRWKIFSNKDYVTDSFSCHQKAEKDYQGYVNQKRSLALLQKYKSKNSKRKKIVKPSKVKKQSPKVFKNKWIGVNGKTGEIMYASQIKEFVNRFKLTEAGINSMRRAGTLIRGKWIILQNDNRDGEDLKQLAHKLYVEKEERIKKKRVVKNDS